MASSSSQPLTEMEVQSTIAILDQLALQERQLPRRGFEDNTEELQQAIEHVQRALRRVNPCAAAPLAPAASRGSGKRGGILKNSQGARGGRTPNRVGALFQGVPLSKHEWHLVPTAIHGEAVEDLHFDGIRHKYSYMEDGCIHVCRSVTKIIGEIFEPFNADAIINENYTTWQKQRHPKYYRLSKNQIKSLWKEDREKGTRMHASIENILNEGRLRMVSGRPVLELQQQDHLEPEVVQGFKKFFTDFAKYFWKIVRSEMRVASQNLALAGCIDLLAIAEDGSLALVDWKRSDKDITFTDSTLASPIFARLGKGPGAGASDYFKYSLQLNVYKLLLERCYELPGKIEHMFIVQLHPNLERGLRVHQVRNMHQEMALIQEYLENSADYLWVD